MVALLHTGGTEVMTRQYRDAAFSRGHSVAAAHFQGSLATFKVLADSAVTTAHDRHDALTRFADDLWTSMKLLDDEVAQYWTENFQAWCGVVQRLAQAKSPAEIIELQSDFLRALGAQATEQTREIMRLSLGASARALQALRT
jgi:phasin family protein